MTFASIPRWLAEAGLRNLPLEDLVDGFARRLGEAGLPIARAFVGMNTLHPMVRARSLVWQRGAGTAARYEFQHRDMDAQILRQSPFEPMIRQGLAERRVCLSAPAEPGESPVFAELRADGLTEWLGFVFPFGALAPQIGGPSEAERVDQLFLVCSFATDRAGGFAEAEAGMLRDLSPLFALAAKACT